MAFLYKPDEVQHEDFLLWQRPARGDRRPLFEPPVEEAGGNLPSSGRRPGVPDPRGRLGEPTAKVVRSRPYFVKGPQAKPPSTPLSKVYSEWPLPAEHLGLNPTDPWFESALQRLTSHWAPSRQARVTRSSALLVRRQLVLASTETWRTTLLTDPKARALYKAATTVLNANLPLAADLLSLAPLAPPRPRRPPTQAPLPTTAHMRALWEALRSPDVRVAHLAGCVALQVLGSFRTADLLQISSITSTSLGFRVSLQVAKVRNLNEGHVNTWIPDHEVSAFLGPWTRTFQYH